MTLTQQLIDSVLSSPVEFYDNSNGPYESFCPFCGKLKTYKGNEDAPQMIDLLHTEDCAWSIANKLQKEEYPEMML